MNVTKTLTIKSTITGAEQTAAGLQNVAKAQQGVASSSEQSTKSTLSSEKALERLSRQLDQAYRAQKQFESATRDLDRAQSQGLVTTQRHLELLDLAQKRLSAATKTTDTFGNTLGGLQSNLDKVHRAQQEFAKATAILDKAQASGRISQAQYFELLDSAQKRFQAASRTTDTFGNSLNSLRGQLDVNFRAQQEFANATAALDKAQQSGRISASQYFQLLDLAQQRFQRVTLSQNQFGKSIGLSAGAMQNMSFQLNDIVSGLAMGQSPFQIMVQQGGQVLQILQMHQGGIGGSLRAIGSLIMALPTPIKVLGLAFAAAGGSALAYWGIFKQNVPTAEENLKEHDRLIKVIAAGYEDAADKAHKFFEQSKEVTQLELLRNQTRLMADLAKETANVSKALLTVSPSLNDMSSNDAVTQVRERFKAFRPEIERLVEGIEKGTPNFAKFRNEVAAVGTARPELAAVASELLEVAKNADKSAQAAAVNAAQMRLLAGTATEADRALLSLAGSLRAVAGIDPAKRLAEINKEMEQLGGPKGFPGLKLRQELQRNNELFDEAKERIRQTSETSAEYNARLAEMADKHQMAAHGIRENNKEQKEAISTYDSLIQRTRDRIEELELEAKTAGRTADEVVKLKFINEAERAAAASGGMTEARRKEVEALAEELALRQRIAREAETSRKIFKKAMDEGKDAAQEFTEAFVTGMGQGLSATEAMIKALDQLIKKLASEGIKNLFSGDPATMALGAVQIGAAVVIDIFTKEAKAAKAAEDTAKALQKFNDELVKLSNTINGVVQGTIEAQAQAFTDQANAIADEAQKAAQQAADASKGFFDEILDNLFGQDPEPVVDVKAQTQFIKTMNDINAFIERESTKFRNTFGASIQSLTAGMGLSQIAQEITRLGEALQAFIKDTGTAFGGDTTKIIEATRASEQMLLSMIGGTKTLSDFEKEMLRIDQAAEAVKAALMAMGVSAIEAAGMVERQAKAARDLAIAAEEARIAQERMALELRLLRATTDASTLAGALQIQQLEQQIEMQEAIASGSKNIALLEQIHSAERIALIQQFHQRALEEQEQANKQRLEAERRAREEEQRLLEDAQRTLDAFSRSIKQFIHSTLTGPGSPLSPQARLAQAQAGFQQQLGIIQTGTPQQVREAMNSITSFAQDVLEASKDVFGSGVQGQQIFTDVINTLQGLPDQISVQELILAAVEDQTTKVIDNTNTLNNKLTSVQDALITVLNTGDLDAIRVVLQNELPSIDTNTDGLITFAEMQAALGDSYNSGTLASIFSELDGNGNGVLEKQELTNQRLNTNNIVTGQGNDTLFSIQQIQQSSQALLDVIRAQTTFAVPGGTPVSAPGFTGSLTNNILDALNKIVFNTWIIAGNTVNPSNTGGHALGTLQQGGFVRGGVDGRDSVPFRGHLIEPREFVVRKDVAIRNAPQLTQFNATGAWPGRGADEDLVNEVRNLHRAILHVAARVDEAANRNHDGQKRLAEESRQNMRRPREHGSRANRAA